MPSHRLLTRAIIGALIGARFTYVINHVGDYTDRPHAALRVWEGGASLLGGIVVAVPELRRQRLGFWTVRSGSAPKASQAPIWTPRPNG
jgi:prolipoprotein diacylglyceryltransferase